MDIKLARNKFILLNSKIDYNLLDKYLSFIDNKNNITYNNISHKHHILPSCLFPEYKKLRIHKWNECILELADHIKAHEYLCEIFPKNTGLFYGLYKLYTTSNLACPKDYITKMKSLRWMYKENKQIRIFENDIRIYLLEGWSKGCLHMKRKARHITNGVIDLRVSEKEAEKYLKSSEWVIGVTSIKNKESKNKHRIFINNGIVSKLINKNNLAEYLLLGWVLGIHTKSKQLSIYKEDEVKKINKTEMEDYLKNNWRIGNPHAATKHITEIKRCAVYNPVTLEEHFIPIEETNTYVSLGYILGRLNQFKISSKGGSAGKGKKKKAGLRWIYKENKETKIQETQISEYISLGWKVGRLPKK